MSGLPRSHLAAYAAAFALIALLGARQLARGEGAREGPGPAAAPAIRVEAGAGGGRLVVHVAGAVRRPGVYRLRAGARVDDAVRRAGGATAAADLTGLNLAAELQDGRQVVVPEQAVADAGRADGRSGDPALAQQAASGPLNLGTATLEQLDALDGVGPATAQKILDFRDEHGGFSSVEQLAEIPGIGEKRLASLREQVTP